MNSHSKHHYAVTQKLGWDKHNWIPWSTEIRDILTAAGAHKCINFDKPGGSKEASDDDDDGDEERRERTPLRGRDPRLTPEEQARGEALRRHLSRLQHGGEDEESKKEKLDAAARCIIRGAVHQDLALAMNDIQTADKMWHFLRPKRRSTRNCS